MRKIYLLLLCCVIFLCGCDFNELADFINWSKEEVEVEETLKNCEIKFLNLPKTINFYHSFKNEIKAKVEINKANYEFYEYNGYRVAIKISGEVLYGNNDYIAVNYKLKDEEGNVVRTDHFTFIYELSKGDKFKDYEFIIYDIEPGKYTIEFYDCQL